MEYWLVRIGLILGSCVLGTACLGGDIGGAEGGTRLGSEASDSDVGNSLSALACPGASADVSASSGWQNVESSLPANGALRFEFKARPTVANLDGLVAIGAEHIDAVAKAAITVRFAEDGFVDAFDGTVYDSDVAYRYDPGVWYSVSVSADVETETYDVEIGPCGAPRQTLIENAAFQDDTNLSGQLSVWAVWSSQSAGLEVSTPAWIAAGDCVPSSCETLGQVCGQPNDGCGGRLNCGSCGNGELCSSGLCIDEPVSSSPAAAPFDGDYDHIVTLTGTQTGSSVVNTINGLGAGTVLVRPLDDSGASITGGMGIPRDDVTLYGLDLSGDFRFKDGTVIWGVHAEPAQFHAGSSDRWHIRDSLWSGGAGETPANGCVGNLYAQNFVGGDRDDPSVDWIIENSTFKNYVPTESGCGVDHSEALYMGARSSNGIIRNNVFANNANTAHIFFTWWGSGCTGYSPACSPDNICIEGNSFGQTWTGSAPPGAYFDISSREELPDSLGISIDPAQGASVAGASSWNRICP